MKAWNKETRNEAGEYYRKEDWGVDADAVTIRWEGEERIIKSNFTLVAPPDECFTGVPHDWDEAAQSWVPELEALKALRIIEIDARTSELLKLGFEYNGSSFSMSEAAQRNWAALGAARANGMLSYPLTISTVDEGSYDIQSDNDCLAFLGAYMTYQASPLSPLGNGRVLKAQVTAATTSAEVEAVIDER
jgi:hypothetical protein